LNPDPKPFRFKQFEIHQHQCAMKVGTDGVLLGAWTDTSNCNSILDIGCGTALLSLMLAQKSKAQIDAVEIDALAAEQAEFNCQLSKWSEQITVHPTSIQEFQKKTSKQFDLIISNPPFFSKQPNKSARSTARSQINLRLEEIIEISNQLLSKKGKLSVIIPFEELDSFIEKCASVQLHLLSQCSIKGNLLSKPKRVILSFSKQLTSAKETELIIEKEKRHDYTKEYLSLVEPYLL